MIIHTNSVRFIREVMELQEYKFLFEHLVIIDVGCNIGAFSLSMLSHADQIHAIDISVENIENLKKTIHDNMITEIKPYCLGISGKTETRKVLVNGDASEGGWKMDEAGDFFVDSYSLHDFMKNNGIPYADVMKLDVEGAETEILEAPDFPRGKINTIIGETHGGNEGRVKKSIEELGYRYMGIGSHFIARL